MSPKKKLTPHYRLTIRDVATWTPEVQVVGPIEQLTAVVTEHGLLAGVEEAGGLTPGKTRTVNTPDKRYIVQLSKPAMKES